MITLSQSIRAAGVEDIPRMEPSARRFYASSKVLKGLDFDRFTAVWTQLISSGLGVIYILEDDGEVVGLMGGMKAPDIYSGRLIATEFFWFVNENSRGRGLGLYQRFEDWARAQGCEELRMGYLADSMPEKLKRIYGKLGFTPIEVSYGKQL